jgi:peptidyl-prolyl cis-trans isomerase SurA
MSQERGSSAPSEDNVVMRLGDEEVTFSTFKRTYLQNNDPKKATDEEIREYIDLYVNFRLKFAEAHRKRLDTLSSLREELAGYREQAVSSYLTDKEVSQRMTHEAIERSQWDIRAAHILKKIYADALPADTLEAYKQIMHIRNRLLKGEDFAKVAIAVSDDPSAKDRLSAGGEVIRQGNGGDLGYFSVFDMIYDFETGAYHTPVGQISMPVRTQFGYHLIYVKDKRPAMGQYKAMQILIPYNKSLALDKELKMPDSNTARSQIEAAYKDLQSGMGFVDAIKKYAPQSTSSDLPIFGCNRYDGDFIGALYGLKKGEFSKPVKTSYGWHIVYIEDAIPVTIDTGNIIAVIFKDARSNKSQESFIQQMKTQNRFQEFTDKNNKNKSTPLEDFFRAVDSTVLVGEWDIHKAENLNRNLFAYAGSNYTQHNFAQYIYQQQKHFTNMKNADVDAKILVNYLYHNFVDETIYQYEDSHLEKKNPKFAALMQDYLEGLMLYELTEQRIWRKADADSVDLDFYYQKLKNEHLYPTRVKALLCRCVDAESAAKAEKYLLKGKNADYILPRINKESITTLMDTVLFWQGQNKNFDKLCQWNAIASKKVFANKEDNEVMRVEQVLPPSPKSFADIKGLVVGQYQAILEREWLEELHKNNRIEIDYDAILANIRK